MQNIVIVPAGQELTDFMSLEPGAYKRYMYYQSIADRNFFDASLLIKDDGNIHYSYSVYKIKRSKDGYYRANNKRQGFTLNEKGKLNIWFGGSVQGMPHLLEVLTALKKEWFTSELTNILTKGLLEKVLNGKITNAYDYAKAYIKAMRISCSPKLLLESVKSASLVSSNIYRGAQVAKDLNHYLDYRLQKQKPHSFAGEESFSHMADLERQAMILGKKIDYMWSANRLKQEHHDWTREIMELELRNISNDPLQWLQPFHELMPEGFTLLDTQSKVFQEGKLMHHCVYTNYWSSIQAARYMAIHVQWMNQEATLGLSVDKRGVQFNQIYGKYNNTCIPGLVTAVKDWINEFNLNYQQLAVTLPQSSDPWITPIPMVRELLEF